MITEADTCRKYVLPKLTEAGWDNDPHSFTEQKTFTDGRIVVIGQKIKHRKPKRADYLLRYTRYFMIAVIEAKAAYKSPGDGLQQAVDSCPSDPLSGSLLDACSIADVVRVISPPFPLKKAG